MQDIGLGLRRISLTGSLLIALAISACSGGSATNGTAATSGAGTGNTPTGTPSGTPVTAGSATLTWVAPTENADGTPVTNLAGYTLYYGTDPSDLTQSLTVSGGATTSTEVKDLPSRNVLFRGRRLQCHGPRKPAIERGQRKHLSGNLRAPRLPWRTTRLLAARITGNIQMWVY